MDSIGFSEELDLLSRLGPLAVLLFTFGCGDGGPGNVAVVDIDAHIGFHTCALLSNGSVRCWGQNNRGQLGDGTTNNSSTPVAVEGLGGVTAVAAGTQHTCAILSSGSVMCWGDNFDGELGNGTTTDSSTPVAVHGIGGAIAISAGDAFTCALVTGGSVTCWGYNGWGQLGSSTTDEDLAGFPCSTTPVSVSGVVGATGVVTGDGHACAVVSGGTVLCWGANVDGQLGDGILGTETGSTTTGSPTPMEVVGLSGAIALAANAPNTCALLFDGTVRCWGGGMTHVFGAGLSTELTPVTIQDISDATALSAGGAICVMISDGTVRCWGANDYGQLGDGTTTDSGTPLAVPGVSGALSLATGAAHTCALLSDRKVKCWGYNLQGELGDGTPLDYDTSKPPSPPVTVVGL